MKKQMLSCKYWLAMLVALFTVAGCVDDEVVSSSRGVIDENGMVSLTVQTQVPGLKVTRAVEGDEEISSLWLLAFDENGYMLSRVQANYDKSNSKFTAQVPATTRCIHFLGNVIMDHFNDAENIGRHENEVIAPMVSSSVALVYWGRETFTNEDDLLKFAGGSNNDPVTLYRNQAQVCYDVVEEAQAKGIEVKGWAVCNEYAYSTVAPFDESAINESDAFHFDLNEYDFVTPLPEEYSVKMTDPTEATVQSLNDGDPRYVFENPNHEDDQMYVIMRITTKDNSKEKYYKVLLIDDNKKPYPIIRNHKITVTIKGINENYGVDSFEAAKTATPVNNPWISISDEIPEINKGETTLRIEGETTVIYQKSGEQTIEFYYNGSGTPTVEWLSNNRVSSIDVPSVKGDGDNMWTVTFTTNEPDDEVRRGTLEIRGDGSDNVLSRRVTAVLCKPFEFTPVWISSEIPLLNNEYVTVLFNIPDDFPQELLPIDVKFGSNLIDAMPEGNGGQSLKVIMEETKYEGVPYYDRNEDIWKLTPGDFNPGFNYKYVYSATHTGHHYVQFRTVRENLDDGMEDRDAFFVYMEGADSRTNQNIFETRRLFFAFQEKGSERRILLNGDEESTKYNYASRLMELAPMSGQTISIPFTLGTLDDNGSFQPATLKNDGYGCEIWVCYDPTLLEPTGKLSNSTLQTDYYGNTYVVYRTKESVNEITFQTLQPTYDTNIVLSARSKDHYGDFYKEYTGEGGNPRLGVNERVNSFRSASVEIRSQGALDFKPKINGNPVTGSYKLPYGENQSVELTIDIPTAAQGHKFTLRLGTTNLVPDDGTYTAWPDHKGYDYTINTSELTCTLRLHTNRIVSAETLTLASGSEIGFNAETIRLTNKPLSGKIIAPDDTPFKVKNPNIILERKSDGARIGAFASTVQLGGQVEAKEASYELTLRGEYNLKSTDQVTVRWSPSYDNTIVCTYSCRLSDLLNKQGGEIRLKKQE